MPKKIGADKQRESRTLGEAVGAEITRLRVDRGWSQSKLAHDLGYTERYIGQLERGAKSPTLRTLADLAKAFSTEVSDHNQSCGAATPEQWEALTFSGMELCNSARRLTIRFLFAYTDWHAGRT